MPQNTFCLFLFQWYNGTTPPPKEGWFSTRHAINIQISTLTRQGFPVFWSPFLFCRYFTLVFTHTPYLFQPPKQYANEYSWIQIYIQVCILTNLVNHTIFNSTKQSTLTGRTLFCFSRYFCYWYKIKWWFFIQFNSVLLLWNVWPTGGTQLGAPNLSDMLEREEEEAMEADYWGDGVMDGEGLIGIWYTADGGSFVKLLRANVLVLKQWLEVSVTEST